jgi:hypothetical protein
MAKRKEGSCQKLDRIEILIRIKGIAHLVGNQKEPELLIDRTEINGGIGRLIEDLADALFNSLEDK